MRQLILVQGRTLFNILGNILFYKHQNFIHILLYFSSLKFLKIEAFLSFVSWFNFIIIHDILKDERYNVLILKGGHAVYANKVV